MPNASEPWRRDPEPPPTAAAPHESYARAMWRLLETRRGLSILATTWIGLAIFADSGRRAH